jgi:hypothetical protein
MRSIFWPAFLFLSVVVVGVVVASTFGLKRQTGGLPEVQVRLFNTDHGDVEQLLVGCAVRGEVHYGESKTITLKGLSPAAVLTVQARNTDGAFTYGFELSRGGQTLLRDADGDAGVIGAHNDDFDHPHQLVFSRSFTPDGRKAPRPTCVAGE